MTSDRRLRITGNAIAAFAVLTALASALFSLYPLNATANCYVATRPLPEIVAVGTVLGLATLACWLFLLRRADLYEAQIAACGAMAVVIVVLLAVPALFLSGQYGAAPLAEPWPCSLGFGYTVVVVGSAFVSLVAAGVCWALARWLPTVHGRLRIAALGGVAVWTVYLLWIYLL
jgi:hypothetical protein